MNYLSKFIKYYYLILLSVCFTINSTAQESVAGIQKETASAEEALWMQPVTWIVGGIIFLLLMFALLRRNKHKA